MKTRLIPFLLLLTAAISLQNCSKDTGVTPAFDESKPFSVDERASTVVVPAGSHNAL